MIERSPETTDLRRLAAAEEAVVRFGLEHPGRLTVGGENTLRQAFALARLSLSAPTGRALVEFRRAALGAAHALFGEDGREVAAPPGLAAELLAAAAVRLWPLALAARDQAGDAGAWSRTLQQRQLVLALGGGGGVGYVYLGVFALLEELRIRPALIAGTSFGAILGLMRALRNGYEGSDVRAILDTLSFGKLFRLFRVRSPYVLPGPLRLYLRSALLVPLQRLLRRERPVAERREAARVRFTDLSVPLVVTVAGVRRGMLPRPQKEYEHLLDPAAFFPPTPSKLQRRALDLFSVFGEFVRQPNRLDALYLGLDGDTCDLDVLDVIGFSCSLPGFIHYDILRHETEVHARVRRLLEERDIGWFADGGLVENCPARCAHETFLQHGQVSPDVPGNGFVLALDAFSPKLATVPWIPLERLAQETVRRVLDYADAYVPFPRTLSPLSILPTVEQVDRAVHFGRAEVERLVPLLKRLLAPLPPLEACRPAS